MFTREEIFANFRTPRYADLNKCRWDHFLSMGIPLAGKTVFEPGAGIGDQTEWLLSQGVKQVYVNDGRDDNCYIIHERFGMDPRVVLIPGDLESCLPKLNISADFIYFYGVYYHLNEDRENFRILRELSRIGPTIALDFHAGPGTDELYARDNPSTSLNQRGHNVPAGVLLNAMRRIWGHAYLPRQQIVWDDPENPTEVRQIAVASRDKMDNEKLMLWLPN